MDTLKVQKWCEVLTMRKITKRMILITILTVFLLSLLTGCDAGYKKTSEKSSGDTAADTTIIPKLAEPTEQSQKESTKDDQPTKEGETMNRHAIIETTLGTIEVELFEERAPITTGNFIKLIEKGFYDGVIFHRVIPDFMIQGGDPEGRGTGGPGYTIKDEFHKELRHDKPGILSMANAGPDTGGSQFFITAVPTPFLDNKHAVFGVVVDGMDVVNKIVNVKRDGMDKPLEDVVMKKVSIK